MAAEGVKQRKGGCKGTKTEKVAATAGGQGQKRWLRQRSLGRQIQKERKRKGDRKKRRGDNGGESCLLMRVCLGGDF